MAAVLLNITLLLLLVVQEVEQTEILIVLILLGILDHQVHEKDRQILVVVEEENVEVLNTLRVILLENWVSLVVDREYMQLDIK